MMKIGLGELPINGNDMEDRFWWNVYQSRRYRRSVRVCDEDMESTKAQDTQGLICGGKVIRRLSPRVEAGFVTSFALLRTMIVCHSQ